MSIDQSEEASAGRIQWPDLTRGVLVRRYKRFLADVEIEAGRVVTAHCANSGTMMESATPGRPVYLSYHNSPKRKLKYTWEMIDMPESLVGVNTMVPNRLVAASIQAGRIPELTGYDQIRRELRVGNSRLDLMLTHPDRPDCYIEVKNCTLVKNKIAYFPDAVTKRGQKHLTELQALAAAGHRCIMFFLVQRMDAAEFRPADHIDSDYGIKLRKAREHQVEILVYDVDINLTDIGIGKRIAITL